MLRAREMSSQERVPQLVTQYHPVSPVNIHTQVTLYALIILHLLFRNVCVCTHMHMCVCMHITPVKKKEAMNLRKNNRGIWEGLEGGEAREKLKLLYNLKKLKKYKKQCF